MENGLLMLVDLTQESTDLHVSFTFVFEHFQSQGRLLRIIKIFLEVVAVQVINTCLQADGAFFKNAKLLVAHCHIMKC